MARVRRESVLSVEISSSGVGAVGLERAGAGGQVSLFEWRAIPPPTLPEARRAGLGGALREIAHAIEEGPGRASFREVRVVVSGPGLTLRHLRLPPMPLREVHAAVRYRLPEVCPAPVDRFVVDMLPYREGRLRGALTGGVLVAAFDRVELEEILQALNAAGLRPSAVIPLGVAMTMAAAIPRDPEAGAATGGVAEGAMRGLLDIGAARSCLVLSRGRRILLAREIGIGGDHFTQALARELELDIDEAEKVKRTHGIPSPSDRGAPGEDPALVPSVRNVLRPLAERLVAEIKRSVEFTMQEQGGPAFGDLMIAGGGATLRGLDRGLAEDLGVPVRLFRPRADVLVPAPELRARLEAEGRLEDPALACQGVACLGAAWEKPPINLIAPMGLASARARVPRAAAVLVAGGLALGLYGGSLWRESHRLDATLRAQDARIGALAPRSVSREELSPELLRVVGGAIDFERTFRELDGLIAPGMAVELIRLEAESQTPSAAPGGARVLRVEGFIAGSSEAAERSLARLLAGVEASRVFANVQRVRTDGAKLPGSARLPGSTALRFAFTCDIEEGGVWHEGGPPVEEP